MLCAIIISPDKKFRDKLSEGAYLIEVRTEFVAGDRTDRNLVLCCLCTRVPLTSSFCAVRDWQGFHNAIAVNEAD